MFWLILFIVLAAIFTFYIFSFSALDKENDIRRSACKQKNLPVLAENSENSANDINYILSKICK